MIIVNANSDSLLTKKDTCILKGLAVIMLLIHHLFFVPNGLFNDVHLYGDFYLVQSIGVFCKLCVALFVFLSGYGLMASIANNPISAKDFYVRRFKKLFLNYWFIYLIFVPIGVFVFHRSFPEVYGNHYAIKALLDFLGIYNLFGELGYNPTWWFLSCIIVLYALFPVLLYMAKSFPFFLIAFALLLPKFTFLPFVAPYASYVLPFCVGIWMATIPKNKFAIISIGELIVSILGLILMRVFSSNNIYIIDTLLCVGFALLCSKISLPKSLNVFFSELGKHSMNIFYFHTFIFYYWFTDLIYFSRNPIIIFLELLLSCYLFSLALEFVKKITRFNQLAR